MLFPAAAEQTLRAVAGTNLPSAEVLSRLLMSDLAAIQDPFVLVLDDYHTVHEVAIHQLVTEIIRQLPGNLHLIIASRHDPPFPLAKQRASGTMTELRASHLRFTDEESAEYLRETISPNLDMATAVRLNAHTEGWPAGLYLASLYLRHMDTRSAASAELTGDNRYVMDYLVNEVLAKLPVPIQHFLIKTSILEELCQPLCEAVIGHPALTDGGEPILEWLERSGIFVLPADDVGRWYRCHYLFRRMLRNRLERESSAPDVAALQMRASAWFEENGHLDEALRHALQASSPEAVRIFAEHRHELVNRGERHHLERWVHLFPDSVVQHEPELLLALVWLKVVRQQFTESAQLLDRVEVLLDENRAETTSYLLGEVAARRCTLYFWQGDFVRTLEAGEAALRELPAEWWYIRGTVRIFLSVTFQCLSEPARAYGILAELDEPDAPEDYVTLMVGAQVFVRWAEADLPGLVQAGKHVVSRAARFPESELVNACRFFMGFYHYQRNELAEAEAHLTGAVTFPYASHAAVVANSALLMARMRLLQGRADDAQRIVDAAVDFAHGLHTRPLLAATEAIRADFALRRGRLAEAGLWATQLAGFHPVPYPFPFIPALEAATILLELNSPSSREQARSLLDEMTVCFNRTGYTSVRLQILALQALLAWQEGDEAVALALLEESVKMAEPGRFLRLFPDLGSGLKPLLVRLYEQGVSPSYLSEILAAFNGSAAPLTETPPLPGIPPRVSLTYREQEVLQLLNERRSDKQIAEALVISVETVRSHIYHLSSKLGVHGRRAIVQTAKDLRLIE
jgi:LuxR family maltose regulon positive regulatory protein